MGLLNKYLDPEKTKELKVVNPREMFEKMLRGASGSSYTRDLVYRIYYQVYAFYGVVDGVGTSTIVANTALALAEAGLTVCVIDTSILAPTQDILLNTNEAVYNDDKEVEHWDWFDMPYTRTSVLHISKINHNVSVLSFKGKNRGIVDFLSTNDSESLVTMALSTLHSKFDLILIDCCHEMTSINTACLQQAHQVIQVWNDSPVVMANMEGFITNAITMSCPLDKMRYVVYNKLCQDALGSLDGVLKQYRLKCIGESYFSEELYLKIVTGKSLFRCESTDSRVIEYTEFIIRILCHILNIDLTGKAEARGSVTSQDILDGRVEGTLHHEMAEAGKQIAVEVDKNPMGSPDFIPQESENDFGEGAEAAQEAAETAAEVAYATDAMQYGGVMPEDDVREEDLTDEDGDGVPDIFESPERQEKKKKRRGLFGRKKG